MEIYRLSYTCLSLYERGDFDGSLAAYLGRPHPFPTELMELGKAKHKIWEHYINENLRIPEELGGGRLHGIIRTEKKHERLIELGGNKFIQLVGVIDCEALPIIYDWKITLRNVNAFVKDKQKWYYKLLIPEAERFELRAYNPLLEQIGIAICYLTDKDIDNGLEWIVSLGTDFINLLENMYGTNDKDKLLKIYKPQEIIG